MERVWTTTEQAETTMEQAETTRVETQLAETPRAEAALAEELEKSKTSTELIPTVMRTPKSMTRAAALWQRRRETRATAPNQMTTARFISCRNWRPTVPRQILS